MTRYQINTWATLLRRAGNLTGIKVDRRHGKRIAWPQIEIMWVLLFSEVIT